MAFSLFSLWIFGIFSEFIKSVFLQNRGGNRIYPSKISCTFLTFYRFGHLLNLYTEKVYDAEMICTGTTNHKKRMFSTVNSDIDKIKNPVKNKSLTGNL